ncbi:MAG: sodium:calcium antiporter [Candidatus Heimdallarchaeota archaeon]
MIVNPFVDAIGLLIVMSVAAEFIARSAQILEHKYGAGFVGSIILGFVTTFPELVFVCVAVLALDYDIAMGSAIGGNILLFTVGYGLVIVLAYIFHKKSINLDNVFLRDDLWYLLISCIMILLFALDGVFQAWEGIVLIGVYIVYVLHQYYECRRYKIIVNANPNESVNEESNKSLHEEISIPLQWKKSAIYLLIGGVLLLLSAEPFVEAIGELSHEIGVSALVLALVISPLASEMPEKISAFILTTKDIKGAEMSIANFIGSKVQNNTLLFGIMILLASSVVGVPIVDTTKDFLLLLVMTLTTIVGVKLTYDLKLHPREGLYAVILYIIAIFLVFWIHK